MVVMASRLSIRGNAEERGDDPNVTPLIRMTTRVFANPYSEQNPEVVERETVYCTSFHNFLP